ncbi:type II toxin-antitoxin system VapC family toxin [Pelagibacterium sediminicola]|uniref:type II toxin-antitoxin system VapC family toxin n=1 Tax=Pelagibacterium sediminicola TaxID=2248761 RepID=UPI000E314664|nr:type II toxin-antitoxin system VapC family toxin [Pelagibacterium sediminicola]
MIFLDTNVVSETFRKMPDPKVLHWLNVHRFELAIPSMVIAKLNFGIERKPPEQRSSYLAERYAGWKMQYEHSIFDFDGRAAVAYGHLMGHAERLGRPMSVPDGIIAAIALVNGGRLATRNLRDFETTGLDLISPWD